TMANKTLFANLRDVLIPQTDTVNSENAAAYALAPKQALAQYAATGCFGRTFYATADEQLTRVLELCVVVDPKFVAQIAIYSRTQSFMKDMPALLCAWLSARDARLHEAVFTRVIDNTRMDLDAWARHAVLEAKGLASLIGGRLRDAGGIQRARVFAYQLLTGYQNCAAVVPQEVRGALQAAMELAIATVPAIDGDVVV